MTRWFVLSLTLSLATLVVVVVVVVVVTIRGGGVVVVVVVMMVEIILVIFVAPRPSVVTLVCNCVSSFPCSPLLLTLFIVIVETVVLTRHLDVA
jgi:hypothetical protein